MSTGLLERPPKETTEARAQPAAPVLDPEGADAQRGGYAMKFARRRRRGAHVEAESRGRRLTKRGPRGPRGWLPWLLAPGLIVVVAVSIAGAGAGQQVPVPPLLEPSAFTGVLAFDETSRAGTLFHARLHEAPSVEGDREFRSRVDAVAKMVADAGYDSVLIQAPDGTTLVSGPIASPTFAPPGT